MKAEDYFYRLDPRKVRIVSGDIPAGYWELHGCTLERSGKLFGDAPAEIKPYDRLELDRNIKRIEVQEVPDPDYSSDLLGIGVGAFVGLRFLGPLGAIGGALAGHALMGNRQQQSVDVILHDGRRFSAIMDRNVFQRLKAIEMRSESSCEA